MVAAMRKPVSLPIAPEISGCEEEAKDSTTEGSRSGNDALKLLVYYCLTMASHDLQKDMISRDRITMETRTYHLLILQLLGNVLKARARNPNPSLRERAQAESIKVI